MKKAFLSDRNKALQKGQRQVLKSVTIIINNDRTHTV